MPTKFRLKELLESARPPINQSELARRSGVSLVTINAMANNRTRQVQLDTLHAISQALGCNPGDLLERDAPAKARR